MLIDGTRQPLWFYGCNLKKGLGAARCEIRNARNVRVFSVKIEEKRPIFKVHDSENIAIFSSGAMRNHCVGYPGVGELAYFWVTGTSRNVLFANINPQGCGRGQGSYTLLEETASGKTALRYPEMVAAKLPKQHPVGMTSVGDMNPDCLKSPADWTSLSTARWDRSKDPWASAPPTADVQKVVLLDTDHIGWKIFINDAAFTRAWVWKSFTRGYSTLLMENLSPGAGWIAGRAAMGHTRGYAERMDLAKATPQLALASTGYCLAIPGTEYLVYLPEGGKVTVDLSNAHGKLTVEWLRPTTGQISPSTPVPGGAQHEFTAPFPGDAVLYLQHRKD